MDTRSGDDKSDPIASPSAGAAGHLLQFRRGQWPPATGGARICSSQNHGTRRKIDPRCDCGRGEDCIKQTSAHQVFDQKFPTGNVAGMM